MMKTMEIRKLQSNVGFDQATGKVTGKVIPFKSESKYIGFVERIMPEACSPEFMSSQDIYLLFDHKDDKVLGRCNRGIGNMTYDVREDGVYFSCDLLDNTIANDARSYINAGIMDGCSFGFVVDPDKEEWYRTSDGTIRRDIRGFKTIAEFSVTYNPAYAETSVTCRSLDKFLEQEKLAEEKRNAELNAEYAEYLEKINSIQLD